VFVVMGRLVCLYSRCLFALMFEELVVRGIVMVSFESCEMMNWMQC